MKLNKMREEMTASFLAALKEEKMPWHKEWSSINGRPRNAINGSHYRGINAFWLAFVQENKEYTDPRWCTYNQAKAQGWQVRKGEKGTKVEFWSMYDTETKEKITKQQAEELQKQLSKEDFYDRIKPISNVYTVFNGEQIEGIPEITVERHMLDEQSLMEKRDILLKNMGVGFQEGKEGAFYQSKTDVIGMPDIERFENEYAYLSVMLHEAGHATGHESRLNRKLGNAFGSPEYAKEELRAEIASAFTAQALGIDARNQEHMENHKAYVQSWIEVLEKNPEELFAAIRDAEIISDYLIEKGEFESLEVKQTEKGKEKGTDQELEGTTEEFNESQMAIIEAGNKLGLDTSIYARTEFNSKQMESIYLGLRSGHDVSIYAKPEFTWEQMEILRTDIELGVDVSMFAKPEISAEQMRSISIYMPGSLNVGVGHREFNDLQLDEIQRGLESGVDISVYANPEYDPNQMWEIYRGLMTGLDVSSYTNPQYDHYQMEAIREGLEKGLDVSIYANPQYGFEEMEVIREGLEQGLDVSIYADPKYHFGQMNEIRLGLEQGLDVTTYADPQYDSKQMEQIRKGLEKVPEVKNDTMKKIEEFAKEHNVPIYEEMPEGFHINEGAMTAPPGAKWIMDNAPILEKQRGLLLDKEMIQLLESQTATPPKASISKKHYYTKEESQQMTAYLREHISIVDVCSSLGYTPVRVGQNYYEFKEHDSVRLDIRSGKNCFYWNSTGDRGSVIDACQAFGNMSEAEAFQYLYDMAGGKEAVYDAVFGSNPDAVSYKPKTEFVNDHSEKKIPSGEVQLPPKGTSNRNVYAYLGKTRQISGEVITEFFKRDMLYQDDHNNCVFVSRDGEGKPVFGCKRGTSTYQRFVADCSGNDYSKGFYVDNGGDKLFVGESVIDIMSKMSMLREEGMDYHDYNYLALAGTQKQDPVLNVLDSHPEIKEVVLGLDHDAGGLKATEEIINSLMKQDITVKKDMPIEEGQDWNDALRSYRKAKETGEHQDMDQKVTVNVEPDNVVEGDSIPKEPLMVEKVIEKYMNQSFDGFQMHEIRKGIEAGVDVELYATPDFNSWQMGKIREGLEQGLDVSIYANPEFDFSQMNQILWGLQKGLDVSVYAKPEFNNLQMVEIKLGLAKGQDVSQYANPAMDYKEMNKIRTEQKDALKDSQSPSKEELQDRPGSARDLKGKMNAEEIYQRMTDAEKEIYDMNVDFGDRDGAKKMLEEKAKELEKEDTRDHPDQVDEIKKSIENPSGEAKDLTVYTNPSQMETVKELIQRSKEQGLNVTVYADERYTDQQREALRDEIQSCFEENSRQSDQEQMEGIWDSGSDQNPDYIKIFGQSQNNGMNQDSLSKMAVNRRILQRRGVEL